jgi:integrase
VSAIRSTPAVAATDNARLAPASPAGIDRVKSAKSIGVRSGRWLTLRQAQALLNVPDISTTKGMRDRAIIAVLLGCALRRCEVAALTDGRCLGGFTLEATVAARHANTPELSVW